jgi:hypothetical protein
MPEEKPKIDSVPTKLREGWQPAPDATGADPSNPPKANTVSTPITTPNKLLKNTSSLSPFPDAGGADPSKPPQSQKRETGDK